MTAGYPDYQRLNSYHLYNVSPRDLLVSQFPDIQLLDTCAVTSNIKLIVSAEIDEILGSHHWINVTVCVEMLHIHLFCLHLIHISTDACTTNSGIARHIDTDWNNY